MGKILITGGGGYLGFHTAIVLEAAGIYLKFQFSLFIEFSK